MTSFVLPAGSQFCRPLLGSVTVVLYVTVIASCMDLFTGLS